MITARQLTAPPFEPISRAQAKLWCRIDDDITAQDAVIDLLIKAMREYAENLTGRVFIRRTFQLVSPCVQVVDGRNGFVLPYPPLISVESIRYYDTDGTDTLLAASDYNVHTWREPGIIVEDWDATWPSYRREPDAWRINFTAGHAPGSPDDQSGHTEVMPAELKLWMEARISTLYEHREQFIEGHIVQDIPRSFADGLLDSLIIGNRLF